jgi:transposase InsO family protein
LINDNASEFSSKIAKEWHKRHNTRVLFTTPAKPRSNGKIKQLNGVLKIIMIRVHLTHSNILLPDLLQFAVNVHNRTSKPNG